MALSFPLTFPAHHGLAEITFSPDSAVGYSDSPFTFEGQTYVHQGEHWLGHVVLPGPMVREIAQPFYGWLVALNGMEGTFTLGDPSATSPLGTWTTPQVDGAHAQRVKTVAMKNMGGAGVTGKRGDWLQFGSGANVHLHMVAEDFTADGSGLANVEIWPMTRTTLANNDDVTLLNTVGHWRLATNRRSWTLREITTYGISFPIMEAGL